MNRSSTCCLLVLPVTGLLLSLALPAAAAEPLSPEAVKEYNRGAEAFEERRYDDALKHFEAAVRLAREFRPEAKDYRREAQRLASGRNFKEALEMVRKALARADDDKPADTYYYLGYLLRKLDEPADALRALDRALELQPEHEPAADELLRLLIEQKRYLLAIERFQALSKKCPNNIHLIICLGRAYQENGDYKSAVKELTRAVKIQPDDESLHEHLADALQELPEGMNGTVQTYETLVKELPDQPFVKLYLAHLYVENGQKDKAIPLLGELSRADALHYNTRFRLAREFFKAERYDEAVYQMKSVLNSLETDDQKLQGSFEYGRMLVKAGKTDEGIRYLKNALALWPHVFPGRQPRGIYFHLGYAHSVAKDKKAAEEYFRHYLRLLEGTALGTDAETAEMLVDVYLGDRDYRKAAEVIESIPRSERKAGRWDYRLAEAYFGLGEYEKCRTAARQILEDKDQGPRARLLLARAYLEDRLPDKAIENLRPLKGTPAWNEEMSAVMGRALLASNRSEEALGFIEQAYDKQPNDEQLTLLYARVLTLRDRHGRARELYEQVAKHNPSSVQAWTGLGDLEMRAADGQEGSERVATLNQAIAQYKKALEQRPEDPEVLAKFGRAERDLARAEADVATRTERFKMILYTGGLLLAALLPLGLMGFYLRERRALRCFDRVLDLERDLVQLVRRRAQMLWGEHWQQKLGEQLDPGRINYPYLRDKARACRAGDLLEVADFNQLVTIIEEGWEVLGFNRLCTSDTQEMKRLIIGNLNYIGACRNAIAHGKELQANSPRSRAKLEGHMNRQVKLSLRVIRTNFDLSLAPPPALPMLAPADGPSLHIRRGQGV